jgi:hypothetical protein
LFLELSKARTPRPEFASLRTFITLMHVVISRHRHGQGAAKPMKR